MGEENSLPVMGTSVIENRPRPVTIEPKQNDAKPKGVRRRAVVVEPVLFMYAIGVIGSTPVVEQYLYARFKQQYPILNDTTGDNDTNPCFVNHSDPYFIATQSVQSETSHWQMLQQVVCAGLAIFTTVIYGPYSDVAGRRFILLLPSIAAVVKFTTNVFIIHFNLPVWTLLIGQVVEGMCGGFYTLTMAVFSYIADTTTPDSRGMRITIAEGTLALAMAITQLGLGYFIRETGFLYPYITLSGILGLNLIYLYFFVPETIFTRYRSVEFSILGSLKETYRAFTEKEHRRNVKVGLLVAATFCCSIPLDSKITMIVLFTMNVPLCWGPALIGVFTATSNVAVEIGGIISLKFFKLCRLPEMWIAVFGTLSVIAGSLTNSWAKDNLMMYMVCVASIFTALPIPMCRTMMSRLVRMDEQGTMFAGLASVQAINSIASSLVMNIIYQKTLYFMTGFIFIIGAAFGLITFFILIAYILFTIIQNQRGRGLTF